MPVDLGDTLKFDPIRGEWVEKDAPMLDPKLQQILANAGIRMADVTVSPMHGGQEVEVFVAGNYLGRFGMFGSQPMIERLRVEAEAYVGGSGTYSAAGRATGAVRSMMDVINEGGGRAEIYGALSRYLGGAEYPFARTDPPMTRARGASYLPVTYERTTT